jgi:predicted short-subunit dehydrogenase-like oxidoreductase (DUF2520 family)
VTIVVIGAGKVGRALTTALRAAGHRVELHRARDGLPRSRIDADLLVLAVRDGRVGALAAELARAARVGKRTAVVHVAGALGPDVLAPLRRVCAGVGQAHPLLSFASPRVLPSFASAHLLVSGDAIAVKRAMRIGRSLGMIPRRWKRVDRIGYHAAAALVANGAAALAAAGKELLRRSGCPERDAARVLAPLLRSVAENIGALGLPQALTGPVRRGDAQTARRHLATMRRVSPEIAELYRAIVRAQVPLARALGDAPPEALAAVENLLNRSRPRRRVRRDSSLT